jgi:hypothetical protein
MSVLCIGLDDLEEDARGSVDTGLHQPLPGRDSCGRVLIAAAANYLCRLHMSSQSSLRMKYFVPIGVLLTMKIIGYGADLLRFGTKGDSDTNMEILSSIVEATYFLGRPSRMPLALNLVAKSYVFVHRARLRVHFCNACPMYQCSVEFWLAKFVSAL